MDRLLTWRGIPIETMSQKELLTAVRDYETIVIPMKLEAAANYYETVVIPERIAQAKKEERETILIKLRSKLKIAFGVISITQEDLFELDTDIFPIRPEVEPDGTVSNWDKLSEDTKQRYSKQLKQEGI